MTYRRIWSALVVLVIGWAGGASPAAWAGDSPVRAGCAPLVHTSLHAYGNALPMGFVHALLLQGSGAAEPNPLGSGESILGQTQLFQAVRERIGVGHNTYSNVWNAAVTAGCTWRPSGKEDGISVSAIFFTEIDQRLSFSDELIGFLLGDPGPLRFSAAERLDQRRGVHLRLGQEYTLFPSPHHERSRGTTAVGAVAVGANLRVWRVEATRRVSLTFERSELAGGRERWRAQLLSRSSLWDQEETGFSSPGEPRGGGYALGLDFTVRPTDWLTLAYALDPLFGKEEAQRVLRREMRVDTDTVYRGADGYLWNHPVVTGASRLERLEGVIAPRHTVEVEAGRRLKVRLRAEGEGRSIALHHAGIVWGFGTDVRGAGLSGSEVELRWLASLGRLTGRIRFAPVLHSDLGRINVTVELDSLNLLDAMNAHLALEGVITY